MKLYSGAITARKNYPYEVSISPITVAGENEESALGKALLLAREEYPNKDDWFSHNAHIMEVPLDWIEEAYKDNFETSE